MGTDSTVIRTMPTFGSHSLRPSILMVDDGTGVQRDVSLNVDLGAVMLVASHVVKSTCQSVSLGAENFPGQTTSSNTNLPVKLPITINVDSQQTAESVSLDADLFPVQHGISGVKQSSEQNTSLDNEHSTEQRISLAVDNYTTRRDSMCIGQCDAWCISLDAAHSAGKLPVVSKGHSNSNSALLESPLYNQELIGQLSTPISSTDVRQPCRQPCHQKVAHRLALQQPEGMEMKDGGTSEELKQKFLSHCSMSPATG